MIIYLQHNHNVANRNEIRQDVRIINHKWQKEHWQQPCQMAIKYGLLISVLMLMGGWAPLRILIFSGAILVLLGSLLLNLYLNQVQ